MIKFNKIKLKTNFNLSLQLLSIFFIALFLGNIIPLPLKSFFYSVSLSIKAVLVFTLPLIIFSCLFHSLVANRGKAFRFVSVLLFAVCVSNFISILASYGFSIIGLPTVGALSLEQQDLQNSLTPVWELKLPTFIPNEWALFLGLGAGLLCSLLPYQTPIKLGNLANRMVNFFLQKWITPLLPLFALGFILKMQHDGILTRIVTSYGPIILLMIGATLIYIVIMFFIAAQFNIKVCLQYLKNVIPVGILGFSTMSSMATMPATLNAAEKNTENPPIARAVIPATVNIHMIGDSISLPILAMAVLLTFGQDLPNFTQYLLFTQFFMLAKFAVPGIPCGTIFVVIPILEKYLGFTSEMSAFIAAIYILFDPILTAGNVLGNSALAIMLSRMMQFFSLSRKQSIKPAMSVL